MHRTPCIVGGCRKSAAELEISPSGRYCVHHERQRVYEDLLGKSEDQVRAWERAQEIMRERARRLARRAPPREKKPVARKKRVRTEAQRAEHAAAERERRKALRIKRRRQGKCLCGRKARKGLRSCGRCSSEKHPAGAPRPKENLKLRSTRQKRYYRKCKKIRQCVHCTNPAFWDPFKGRYLTACYNHLTAADSSRISKLKKRADVREERLARGETLPIRQIDDTGDVDVGEALVVTDNEAPAGELSRWRHPGRG